MHTLLCQRELAQFADGASGDLIVACTQEQRLLGDVAEEGGKAQAIRFVNIRETGGWSAEAAAATPKIAALLAMAALPDPEPVPSVAYKSEGQLLITGPLDAALGWADALSGQLAVTVLATGRTTGAALPVERSYPVFSGKLTGLTGWLGAFEAQLGAGKPDRPRPVHALQRVPARVSGAGDRRELPGRPRPLQEPPRVRGRVRSGEGDRLSPARTSRAPSASTSCSTSTGPRGSASTSRRRATSDPARIRSRRRRR